MEATSVSLETYSSSTEFKGITIPIHIDGFCLYIFFLQTLFHYPIFFQYLHFYAAFSIPPFAFEIVCAITSLALLETSLLAHPIIMLAFFIWYIYERWLSFGKLM